MKLGLCLAPDALSQLPPPSFEEIEDFAARALSAEGFEPPFDRRLELQVVELIRTAFSRVAARPEYLDMAVLDGLGRGNIERIDDVLYLVNVDSSPWPGRLRRSLDVNDVLPALVRLVRRGDAEALVALGRSEFAAAGIGVMPAVPVEQLYFRITRQGEAAHEAWA